MLSTSSPPSKVEDFFARCQVKKKPRSRGTGGRTETVPTLHAFWCLHFPATETRIETVCRIGGALAIRTGGDPAFGHSGQVIGVPRSEHFKEHLELVQLCGA
jgi:hypothetical protein